MNYQLPDGYDVWKAANVYYQKDPEPWTLFVPDQTAWAYYAAILIANFTRRDYTRSLLNPFYEPFNPSGNIWYFPPQNLLNEFPRGCTHEIVAKKLGINYDNPNDPYAPKGSFEIWGGCIKDVPDWVILYIDWLELQKQRLGEIKVREHVPFPF